MSSRCAPLPLKNILKELMSDDKHSCDLVELHDGNTSVTMYRAASLLDDDCCRPHALDSRIHTVSMASLFLPAHPLSNTHCIGTHRTDSIPVVTGIRMPHVDAESPSEILVKRRDCALVLFHPIRTATDLVADVTNDAAWVDAYRRWEPTRLGFVSQFMANMDDFYRVEKQTQDAAASEHDNVDMLGENNDDVMGTRHEVEAMVDGSEPACEDPSGDEFDACVIGDKIPVVLTTTQSSTSAASSTTVYHPLLMPVAQTTASTHATLSQAPAFTVEELSRYEVIELLSKALDPAAAIWVSSYRQRQHADVNHYATIAEVPCAFTLNQRQHAAFTIIATALLRTFLRQEQAGLEFVDGATNDRSSHDVEEKLRDKQLLMFLGGGGTRKSRIIDAVNRSARAGIVKAR
ncbi:hypothetical protein L916_04065 [Phytophthora nicotianae]|uniref:ATP-dependent DNA helicase n=1 Tax=Phytophthora nicotianae TaxID=4792 RepID=W2JK50_PHYNI|nr:hypothetical protein L916_04065 [Phytophthora nicotianae]